jgi:hypothetical protein
MNPRVSKLFLLAATLGCLFISTGFAATRTTTAVTPSVTVAGNKVFLHTAVSNLAVANEAVTVSVNITNPGTCVTGHLPTQAGAFAFGLRPNETRLADLSMDIPASACSGTYGVTVIVKNSAGIVLASASAKFTVTVPTP